MLSRYNFDVYNSSTNHNEGFYIYVRASSVTSKRKVLKLGITSDVIASNVRYKYNTLYNHLIETNYLFISQQKYNKYHAKTIIAHLNSLCVSNYGIRYVPITSRSSLTVGCRGNDWYMFNDMNFKKVILALSKSFKSL